MELNTRTTLPLAASPTVVELCERWSSRLVAHILCLAIASKYPALGGPSLPAERRPPRVNQTAESGDVVYVMPSSPFPSCIITGCGGGACIGCAVVTTTPAPPAGAALAVVAAVDANNKSTEICSQ